MNERDKKIIIKIIQVAPTFIGFRCIFEGSDYHIDDMPMYKFDLSNFAHMSNRDEIMHKIAQSAWAVASSQETVERIENSPIAKVDFESLLNQEISMTLGEVYAKT